jgi:hypothetical protein
MKTENDTKVPGGVYLCQVNDSISCGACCGLYNVADTRREAMQAMLLYRSEKFATTPRDVGSIDAFKKEIEERENQERPFPEFHHCPYIGLIGERYSRVGCLLHPMARGNNGIDFRGLSYYGGMACRDYFCPATKQLPARYKEIVRAAAEDWHPYGMVVTERRLVSQLFTEVERRLGRELEVSDLKGSAALVAAIQELLRLKLIWPYRAPSNDRATLCHYIFEDGKYERPQIDYVAAGPETSKYDGILRELSTSLSDSDTLRNAEDLIEKHLQRVVDRLLKSSG